MNEEDAREMWCPMARCIYAGNPETKEKGYGPYNRFEDDDLPTGSYCITGDCMMWKWTLKFTEGYCGLGGNE